MQKLAKVSWLHSSGMPLTYAGGSRDTVARLFTWVHEHGNRTSFDLTLRVDNGEMGPDFAEALDEILHNADYLLGVGSGEFVYSMGWKPGWETRKSLPAMAV